MLCRMAVIEPATDASAMTARAEVSGVGVRDAEPQRAGSRTFGGF